MSRIPVVAAVSGLVLGVLSAPASAAVPAVTQITGFSRSAATVSYAAPTVTFQGQLVQADDLKTPVSSEAVEITFRNQDGTATVGSETTDAEGRFSIDATLPGGGYVWATFAGDSQYRGTSTAMVSEPASHSESRLVLDPVPKSVSAGTTVTFSGTAQTKVGDAWQPLPRAAIELIGESFTTSEPDTTYQGSSGVDGRFGFPVRITETSGWRVETDRNDTYYENWYYGWSGASFSPSWIYGVSQTRITTFSVPAKVEAHAAYYNGALTASGTAQRWDGSAWVPLKDATVRIYYRPKGSSTWHADTTTGTGLDGSFSTVVNVRLGTADWQARIVQDDDTLPSTGPTKTDTVTDKVHFASVSASRGSKWSQVDGDVTDWYNGQESFSALVGLKVRLYYRRKGTATWHYYRTTTTWHHGIFDFTRLGRGRGYYYRVVFPAQGSFLGATSRTF